MIIADYHYVAMCDKCKKRYEEIFFDIYSLIKHLKKRGWSIRGDTLKCYCSACKEKEEENGRQKNNRDESNKKEG